MHTLCMVFCPDAIGFSYILSAKQKSTTTSEERRIARYLDFHNLWKPAQVVIGRSGHVVARSRINVPLTESPPSSF